MTGREAPRPPARLGCVECGAATYDSDNGDGPVTCVGCLSREVVCVCEEPWTHVVKSSPWPERVGLKCRIVPKPLHYDRYPWIGSAPNDAVIEIENDPLRAPNVVLAGTPSVAWTCVLLRHQLEAIG